MSDEFEKTVLKELKDIKHTIDVMNESIVLLEHRLTFEVPALYDGYSMCRDMHEIQHSRLNSLSFKVEDHSNRISILEQKAL